MLERSGSRERRSRVADPGSFTIRGGTIRDADVIIEIRCFFSGSLRSTVGTNPEGKFGQGCGEFFLQVAMEGLIQWTCLSNDKLPD